jgi:7-cyano-7-deazaguanine synthase in queuosine biosynthesis
MRVDVVLSGAGDPTATQVLSPGHNMHTGERAFRDAFGAPTTLEVDLLTVAAAIYCTDLAAKRGRAEDFTRRIQLTVPVTNVHAFNGVKDELTYALTLLSHDAWTLRFVPRPGSPEPVRINYPQGNGKVLLFSGGMDSMAGALHFGGMGTQVALVSHTTANPAVGAAQNGVAQLLAQALPGRFERFGFRVGGVNRASSGWPFPSDQAREETQRTRSFLFLALAALVARRTGRTEIVVIAENGQMAIHLPLSTARIGGFSTHTAHPEYVEAVARSFGTLLQYPLAIENPFLYQTKGEVIAPAIAAYPQILPVTVSCWKASRVTNGLHHCGACIPCYVRRIALEAHGVRLAEYQRDVFAENLGDHGAEDEGKRNLLDLGEFVQFFARPRPQAEVEFHFPDLINPHFDSVRATEMYRRFAGEALQVFNMYPAIRTLLS